MTEELIIEIMSEVFYTSIIILLPILGVALVVGVLISIFQAATSIQEMTLTFVPKILATALVIIIAFPWILDKLVTITIKFFNLFPTVIK